MIEEADFQKIGNAAIDLCVFVEKLRLGNKHKEEADKLTHNVLNLIKQTEKIKEEPLTKGNKMGKKLKIQMSKKLKIQFWKAEKALAMQILEQEGSFCDSEHVYMGLPELCCDCIYICDEAERGNLDVSARSFVANSERDAYLDKIVKAITNELFTGEGELKIGEMCEVRGDEFKQWEKRKLIAILPEQYIRRFVAETEAYPDMHTSWNYARPITKRTEPTVEECGNVVTYTWEEK